MLAVLLAVAFVVVAVLVSGNRSQPSYRPGYAPSGMGAASVPVAAVATTVNSRRVRIHDLPSSR